MSETNKGTIEQSLIVHVFYDLLCGKCGKWRSTDFYVGVYRNKKRMKARAKDEGWKRISDMNLCPICAIKESEEQQ